MSSIAVNSVTDSGRHLVAEKPVRVLICVNSAFTRAEIQRLLEREPGIEVAGAVQSAKHLRSVIAETDPDVVLLHFEPISQEMPWKVSLGLGVAVVLLMDKMDTVEAETAVAEGVQAILVGEVTGSQLATAALAAAAGLLTFSGHLANLVRQGLSAHVLDEADDPPSSLNDSPEKLTPRELEVLEMISEGLSNKEIAALLNISVHTAKFHISSILGKLGASGRAEAAAIGLRHGLITI